MTFIWPIMLVFLILIPIGIGLYIWLQRRQKRLAADFGAMGFTQSSFGKRSGARRHVPALLFLSGLAILTLALARPQAVISLPKIEGTVILAFDVSGSMAAEDMQPSRLEAAKVAAQNFVNRQPSSVQIGVVAFSDSGIAVQNPTNNREDILAAIDRLKPQRSTSLANGIDASLKVVETNLYGVRPNEPASNPNQTPTPALTPTPVPNGTHVPAAIVLLTDGENTSAPNPLNAAQTAADRGVRIYTIGVGSPTGADLNVNGFMVHTQLDETTLQQIAQISGGKYFLAENEEELKTVYSELDKQLVVKSQKTEITSIFAGASIFILLVGGVFSLLWFGRIP
jgi:Ca-activated chloride channel family protein